VGERTCLIFNNKEKKWIVFIEKKGEVLTTGKSDATAAETRKIFLRVKVH